MLFGKSPAEENVAQDVKGGNMRFRKFIKTIRKKFFFIVVFVLLVELLLSTVIYFWMPERYEATATLLVSHMAEELSPENAELDSKLLSTYREIATSDLVLSATLKDAGVGMTVEQLRQRVRVSNLRDTNLVHIRVWSNIPEVSAALANSLAHVVTEEVHTRFKIDNLQIVDPATAPSLPTRAHVVVILSAGFGLALLIAIIVVVLAEAFDDTLRTPEQVQDVFGRPVLGQIPHGVTRLRRQ